MILLEVRLPTQLVNLDAMIPREDFREIIGATADNRRISEIRVEDLEYGRPLFGSLRKPDFQRVTANWSAEKIADFIKSFLNEEFVPSLIMWDSKLNGKIFVIDGAHRLSALMAWVNNDYGNGTLSKSFFGEDGISDAQKRHARATSDLIQNAGTYADLKLYAQNQDKAPNEETLVKARKLFTSKLDLQWVGGDDKTAESSFFKINVSATLIDPTELGILRARKKPNAIATRALIHAGRGHKFWSEFPPEQQRETEALAQSVNDILFRPILQDPIKTLELPIAGHSYGPHSFQMMLDLVNTVNNITPAMWMPSSSGRKAKGPTVTPLSDDTTGEETVSFLNNVRAAAWLLSGDQAGSLGLHPIVYFYGVTGKFHPVALLAAIRFFSRLSRDNKLIDFTIHRRTFEEFLVHNRHFINDLSHSKGSRTRPLESFILMYETVFINVRAGTTNVGIIDALHDAGLKELEYIEESEEQYRKKFSRDTKSAAYLRDAIDSPLRCAICKARLHSKSMSADHAMKIAQGGTGDIENLRWTHYYCNNSRDAIEDELSRRGITIG